MIREQDKLSDIERQPPRLQIKQYTASKDEGGVQNQREHHIILIYVARHRKVLYKESA